MIEVPLWIFVLICIATYVNVLQYLSLSSKLKRNIKQDNVNGMIVSKGFDEIAHDIDDLASKIDKLEAIYEYKESKE
jgi:hypothetical protein